MAMGDIISAFTAVDTSHFCVNTEIWCRHCQQCQWFSTITTMTSLYAMQQVSSSHYGRILCKEASHEQQDLFCIIQRTIRCAMHIDSQFKNMMQSPRGLVKGEFINEPGPTDVPPNPYFILCVCKSKRIKIAVKEQREGMDIFELLISD